jgi:translin
VAESEPNARELDLAPIEAWARAELDQRHAAREQALRWSRELVRTSATSIRAVHRREFERAAALLEEGQALRRQIVDAVGELSDIYWAGYVQDAEKELVEATVTYALITGTALPMPEDLGVAAGPFLNGLAEAVGELRRYLLDRLRRGEVEGSEPLLNAMDEIYSLLVTLDYPDALTGGLRRSTDSARGILEKTRGDLTVAQRQDALARALARATQAER